MSLINDEMRVDIFQYPESSRDLSFFDCKPSGILAMLRYFSHIFDTYSVESGHIEINIDELNVDFLDDIGSVLILFRSGHFSLSLIQVFMIKTSDTPGLVNVEISFFVDHMDSNSNILEEIMFMIGVLSAWLKPSSFFFGPENTAGNSSRSFISNSSISSSLLSGLDFE